MDTKLIIGNPADIETECLVVIVTDHGDKQKNEPRLAFKDSATEKAICRTGLFTAKSPASRWKP